MGSNTGIVKKLDKLGRILIPIEIRKIFRLNEEDDVEIYIDKGFIKLKKYKPNCIFCNNEKNLMKFDECSICKQCFDRLDKIKNTT